VTVGTGQRRDLLALWAPMAIIVPRLPDLSSSARIEDFYRSQGGLRSDV
jgi:hypothetical protein